jgi:folate-binding protein YgfZ
MLSAETPLTSIFRQQGADFIDVYGVQVPLRFKSAGDEYQSARDATLICDGGHRAWIKVHGTDVCDFFQRTLSSDLNKLNVGECQLSAMLNGKGRWIAELILHRFADDSNGWHLGIDLPMACCEAFLQQLELMHFGEDIKFEQQAVARIRILGKQVEVAHQGVFVTRPDTGVECHEIITNPDDGKAVLQQLVDNDHQLGGWVAQDILRVEGGFPIWGSDFNSDYTLPGTNEWRRASLTKGCYAGQEVVARINTYGEAPQQLCQLHFKGKPEFMTGATLKNSNGEDVGHVSSWIFSPKLDKPLAFAYLKRNFARDGTTLQALLYDATASCEVVALEKYSAS